MTHQISIPKLKLRIKSIKKPVKPSEALEKIDRNSFLKKLLNLYEAISSSERRALLEKLDESERLVLYAYYDKFVRFLLLRELGRAEDAEHQVFKGLFEPFIALRPPAGEDAFVQSLCETSYQILFYLEILCRLSAEKIKDLYLPEDLMAEITARMIGGLIKDFSNQETLNISTQELTRYSRKRVDLQEEDYFYIEKPKAAKATSDDGRLKIVQICTIEVQNWKVLFGFYSEKNNWVSERHIPPEKIEEICEKYNLLRRKGS